MTSAELYQNALNLIVADQRRLLANKIVSSASFGFPSSTTTAITSFSTNYVRLDNGAAMFGPAPEGKPKTARPNQDWLDKRVEEMRVHL